MEKRGQAEKGREMGKARDRGGERGEEKGTKASHKILLAPPLLLTNSHSDNGIFRHK